MDINIIRSEAEFYKDIELNTESINATRMFFQSEGSLNSLEKFRFDDEYETLGNKIYQMIEEYPKIIDEGKSIASRFKLTDEYILDSVKALSHTTKNINSINICTTFTGFDCAAGAYGDTIYFGLEWFINPDLVDIPRTDYRYKYMEMLNEKIDDFAEETIPHEIVHLMSVKPDKENFMFRTIEEGRACYVTHLLNPNWDLNKVLPMDNDDIFTAIQNEDSLMKLAYEELLKDKEVAIKQLFSPTGVFMDIRLAGYYIAYRLIELYFHDIIEVDEKISDIMKFTNGDDLYRLLSEYSNS